MILYLGNGFRCEKKMKIKNLRIDRIEKKEVECDGREGTIDTTTVTLSKDEVTVKITLREASARIADEFIMGEELDISGAIAQQKLKT